MSLLDRQKELVGYLLKGFPDLQLPGLPLKSACAEAGNATQENRCLPTTEGVKDHGSDGLMQWRLERLSDMTSWCTTHFGDWKTVKAQAAFILYETKRDYAILWNELLAGDKPLETLTANISAVFERPAKSAENLGYVPGTPGMEGSSPGRINFAYDVFKALDGTQIPLPIPLPAHPPAPMAPLDTATALKNAIVVFAAAKHELDLRMQEAAADVAAKQELLKQAQEAMK